MAETNAVFGGEHSGHFYFRDFWKADSGMLAALHAIAALGETKSTLSALLSTFNRYYSSGEINSKVSDAQAAMNQIEKGMARKMALKSIILMASLLMGIRGGSTCAPPIPSHSFDLTLRLLPNLA